MATKGNRYAWKHDRQTWTCATHSLCGGTFVACEGDQASRDSEQPHLVPGLICEDRGSLVLDRLQDGCPGRLAPVRLGIYLRRRFCSDPIEVPLIAMSAAAAGDRADMAFILACHLLERARTICMFLCRSQTGCVFVIGASFWRRYHLDPMTTATTTRMVRTAL